MRPAYYNENDPNAAAWIRELIARGLIAPGDVDERSIEDVRPDDLRGYVQHHFFAGIGGWSYSLRLAGWPDDRPIWSASCPCQPYSDAGKGLGFADKRHLWPAFLHLASQCGPPEIVGEQVASKRADAWIDLVHADLEALGYAFGCVPFPAAGVGAPQIRDRNYWVAYADDARLEGRWLSEERSNQWAARPSGLVVGLANTCGVGVRDCGRGQDAGAPRGIEGEGLQREWIWDDAGHDGHGPVARDSRPGPVNSFWRTADWLRCRDEKWRPVEPGTFPLGDGLPARVGRVRGYGNAIVPQAAATFIRAYCEATAAALRIAA